MAEALRRAPRRAGRSRRPGGAVIACAALVACTRPAEPGLEIEVLPSSNLIYKIAVAPDLENWNFGLSVRPPPPTARPLRLDLRFLSAGAPVVETELSDRALASLQAKLSPDEQRWENLDFNYPAAMGIDTCVIALGDGKRTLARRIVPVYRYPQQGRYRLPVRGCWFVASGHDLGVEHRRWYNQSHFGWDLVRLDDGNGLRPGKTRLGQYRAFGELVVAPASGTVVLGQGDRPDQAPGAVGAIDDVNYLLIDHGHGELSKLAHLQQGSLLVAPGQLVVAGQPLARVGNSGQSDAPHLHFHFQSVSFDADRVVVDERPLPIELNDYFVTSNRGVHVAVDRGRPRRGEFVCSE
ncbi:MAG: M23 family metallopeptidase [Deltaproteobacteria bacterium]|nr:M23 family metallopeptidase [Deltaproteobacteria bacterium]